MTPEINLDHLTAADLPAILAISDLAGTERANRMLDLLGRVVEGGLRAVPLSQTGAYLKALDAALGEMLSPKP